MTIRLHRCCPPVVIALLFAMVLTPAARGQFDHAAISRAEHDQHCELLVLTDDQQRQRAREAFQNYQREWNAIIDMQRAILDWQYGIQPNQWRGWDETLSPRHQLLFPQSESAAAAAYVRADDRYFQQLRAAAPWAGEMLELLMARRVSSRFWQFRARVFLLDVQMRWLTEFDPIAVLLDLDIPIRRGSALWETLLAYAREITPLSTALNETSRLMARSPQETDARMKVMRAAESRSIEDSRDLIDARARIRIAPVPLAMQKRRLSLPRIDEITEAIPFESDATRFRDRIMRDAYPMLLDDGRDITQFAAIIGKQFELTAEQMRTLEGIMTAYRAERDHMCASIEPLLAKSFDEQRLMEIGRVLAQQSWPGNRIRDMDPPPHAALVTRWERQLPAWRERIIEELGLPATVSAATKPPATGRSEADHRAFFDDYVVAGSWWPSRARNVIQPEVFRAMVDALPLDAGTGETMNALIDAYNNDLRQMRGEAWKQFAARDGIDAESVELILDWYAERYTHEAALIDTLRTLVPDPSRSQFISLVARARRDLLLSIGDQYNRESWRYDLIPFAQQAAVESWQAIAPILDEYAMQMDRAIQTWTEEQLVLGRAQYAMQAEPERDDDWMKRWTAIQQRTDKLSNAFDDLNTAYGARITGMLTADETWRFEYAINAARYPLIGRPAAVLGVVGHLLATPGTLRNTQQQRVMELRNGYERQQATLLDVFIDHQTFWDTPEQLAQWIQRSEEIANIDRSTRRVNPEEAGLGHPGMPTLETMLDLVIDTMAELREIIGEDVYNALPPAIQLCFLCYELD